MASRLRVISCNAVTGPVSVDRRAAQSGHRHQPPGGWLVRRYISDCRLLIRVDSGEVPDGLAELLADTCCQTQRVAKRNRYHREMPDGPHRIDWEWEEIVLACDLVAQNGWPSSTSVILTFKSCPACFSGDQ